MITLGRNGKREHLLASENVLRQKGVEYFETSRGGDITYHGPGQIVGYPILNLGAIRRDVVWYVRMLEEVMIRATAEFAIAVAHRVTGKTGIWIGEAGVTEEKLGAIGVHISRWVTSHGFAYNVSTDLRYFDLIVPCGIADRKATSLEKVAGQRTVSLEAKSRRCWRKHFGEVFGLQLVRSVAARRTVRRSWKHPSKSSVAGVQHKRSCSAGLVSGSSRSVSGARMKKDTDASSNISTCTTTCG